MGKGRLPISFAVTTTKPKRVGGWLVLFCFGTILFSPLMYLAEALGSKDFLTQFFDVLLIPASLVAGISVWRISRRAKIFVRSYFVLVLALASILIGLATAGKMEFEDIKTVTRTSVFVLIGSLYFRTSRRVKETFGENW